MLKGKRRACGERRRSKGAEIVRLWPVESASRKSFHICLGTPFHPCFHLNDLRRDVIAGSTVWTINASAKAGDDALFYMTRPLSEIVAKGMLLTDAEKCTDPESGWEGYSMAQIGNLVMLERPIKLLTLKTEIPEWGYWQSPCRSHRVPAPHVKRLWSLLRDAQAA